tara:strand:- start:84 stop:539 length:456 start_codon:yes stop_codon:yes gene_type:complete
MPIKSFRGVIASGDQHTIHLKTNDGSVGYKIVKFQILPERALTNSNEALLKVFKVQQTTPITDTEIDWSDNTLMASAIWSNNATLENFPEDLTVVFDNEIVNQDIYITGFETSSRNMNYYLELEQVRLDLNENTVATLKDIRNIEARNLVA